MAEIPHLSTRCPSCGDNTSMPPAAASALAVPDFEEDARGMPLDLYAVLYLCTNKKCAGSTVGYYAREGPRGDFHLRFHSPKYRTYEAPKELPQRPRTFLQDANDSKNSPTACTPAAVRAVEAMMAEFGYQDRNMGLLGRINKAVDDGVLTTIMGDWARKVREIGVKTHTDEMPAPPPTKKDAADALLFANMLAEYLFVLPAKIPKSPKGKS